MSCFRQSKACQPQSKLEEEKSLKKTRSHQQIIIRFSKQQKLVRNQNAVYSSFTEEKSTFSIKKMHPTYEQLKQRLEYYYEQHQIDHAYSIAKSIINHHEQAIKIEDQKLINRVIREQQEVFELQKHIQNGEWVEKHNQKGLSVKIRHENDKTVSSIVEKQLNIPYEIMIAIITQFDLYSEYVPFVPQAKTMKKVARNCRIAWTKHKFPLITARQSNFVARGYDRLQNNGTVFMFVTDIENRKDLQQECEYKPLINSQAVSLSYKFLILVYTPIQQGRGNVKVIGNMDSKMNFLPNFMIQWITVKFGKDFFPRVEEIAAKYKGSKWQQKVKQDPSTFNFNKERIKQFLEKKQQNNSVSY